MLTRTDRRRFPILLAVIAAMAMAMLFSPVQAQEGSAPDQPTGLEAAATHDSVTLTWDDPQDDTITGYVILRRVPGVDPQGHFSELVSDTATAATTYTDDTVAAETRYTYRIKAINGAGTSERSRWSHIDVPAAPEAAEGDDPDGEGDGGRAPGGPGKKANVSEASDGDCLDNTNTTCEVDVGGSVTGNISSRTDFDWFRVDLEAGTRYQIDLEGEPTSRGTLPDPSLKLRDTDGSHEEENESSGVGDNARETYTPTVTGTYYVQAGEVDGETGTYTLSVIVLGANGASEADTDFPETTATTGRVEVGASATGNLSTITDVDWFKVVLDAGKTYQIDMKGLDGGGGTIGDPYLHDIRDSSGTGISNTGNDDVDADNDIYDSQITYTPTTAGAYYLVAAGAADSGTYTLSVGEVETEEPPCTLNDGDFWCGVVTVGPILSGTNTIGHGYIEFSGISGGSFEGETEFTVGSNNYTFEGIYVSSTGGTTGALNFKTVALFSDDDKEALELHIDVDGTSSTRAISDAVSGVATGLILWTSAGLDWSLATTVTARLRTPPSDDPVDDCPGDTTTTCEVDVGGSATGNIETVTDRDWFKVDLEAGKFYQIDLEGDAGGGGTLEDPYLRNIRDSSGAEISETENDDVDPGSNADSRVIFNPTEAGAYYLVASGYGGASDTGTYTLSVTELETRTEEGGTDFIKGTTTLGLVEVGDSATGEIDPASDIDWFRVVLEYDKTYVFDLEGSETSSGTLANPFLALLDASGRISYFEDDDGGQGLNSRFELTAVYSGIHYLSASKGASASSGGTYTLSVSEVVVLVSNIEEIHESEFGLHDEQQLAQAFSIATGSGNYTLTSIEIPIVDNGIAAADIDSLSVSVWSTDSSGLPSASLHTLTNPASITADTTATFNAQPGMTLTLEAGNTYAVVVRYDKTISDFANHPGWSKTGEYDQSGAVGWEIADENLASEVSDVQWFSSDLNVHRMRINGTAVGGDEPPCTLETGDIWCGVVTVGDIEYNNALFARGYINVTGLSGGGFEGETDIPVGSKTYTFTGIYVPVTGSFEDQLIFRMDADFTRSEKETLELHIDVDGTGSTWPMSEFADSTSEGQMIRAGEDFDWSSATTVTARLRPVPPVISVGDVTVTEGQRADFAVTLSRASAEAVTVWWVTTAEPSDTATPGEDFTAPNRTQLTIAANETTKTVSVTTIDDALDEDDETLKVRLAFPTNATLESGGQFEDGVATITDNDPTPTVTVAPASAYEGNKVEFVVTLSAVSGRDVEVGYATSVATGDTAVSGTDFEAATGTLTVLAADSTNTGTVEVQTKVDDESENAETFTLTLSATKNVMLGTPSTATGTINDRPPLAWSTTLTVGNHEFTDHLYGYIQRATGSLTDEDFEFGSDSYVVTVVAVSTEVSTAQTVVLYLDRIGLPTEDFVTLVIDEHEFPFADRKSESTDAVWVWDAPEELHDPATNFPVGSTAIVCLRSEGQMCPTPAPPDSAPTFTSSATFDVAENQTVAGTVVATDSDTGDDVTGYAITVRAITFGTDQGAFNIGATDGVLTFKTAPNFEDPHDSDFENDYRVEVTATSGTGTREMTATQTITVTVTDVAEQSAKPDKPTLAAVSGSTTSLTATWTKPDLNGGPDITGYDLQYRAGATGTWSSSTSYGATVTTATITGLTADTSYQARVLAKNGETDSDWSDASDAVSTNAAVAMMPLDVLVSNYPDGSGTNYSLNFHSTVGANQRHYFAQTFTAGAGFTLTAVDIPFRRVPDNSRVTVSLHARNGSNPGTYLGELDLSGALAVGDNTFAAPAGTALASGTYFVRVRWRDGDTNSLSMTNGVDDEMSAESGWSIEDRAQYSASGSSWSNWNTPFAMRVRGTIDGVPRVATGGVRIESDPDAHDSYGVGEEIEVAVGFTDDVAVDTTSGTPRVALTVGSNTRYADYSASDSDDDELAFVYTVTEDDHDQDGVSIDDDALELNGGAIHKDGDTSTNAVLDHADLGRDSDHRVNRDPFIVSDGVSVISTPVAATDTYGLGEVIEIEVEFSAAVDATTDTDFVLSVGGAKRAPLLRGSGTATLVFGYTVVASDDDDSGIWIGEQDRTLVGNRNGEPQNGEITSAVTDREADLDHDSPGVLSGHKVDGSLAAPSMDDNAAPSFSSAAAFDATENQTAAGTVVAADSDADDSVTGYAITGGADMALFEISASTTLDPVLGVVPPGVLTFKSAPNYEDPQDTDTGNDYEVTVQATSGTGTREMTADQTITVTVTDVDTEAPGKPGTPTVSAGSATSLRVNWSAPSNAGPPITDYDVQYRAGTSGDWSDGGHVGTATTATLTGLSEDTSYQVQVRATNAEGTGDWSDSGSGTTDAAASDDCTDDTTTTCEVDVGGSATGTLDAGDRDWFKVELEADTRYQIDVEGVDTGRGTVADPTATVLDPMGGDLVVNSLSVGDTDSGVGKNARVIYAPTAGGTYFVQVRDLTTSTGTYTLSVIVLGANGNSEADTDFPETTSTSGRVEVGASATGNISTATDKDWFKVVLEADKTYQIDMKGVDGGGGTLVDPWLDNIRDSSGNEFLDTGHDDIGGEDDILDSRIIFTPTEAGTYYLVATLATTPTGTYTLSVREVPTVTLPTLSIVNKSADEGEPITFVLSLSEATSENVTVTCTATFGGGDTAVAEDLTFTSANGRVLSGQVVGACSFRSVQDTTDEEDETFTVTLSGVSSNAQLAADPTAKGTILDDDDPPVDDSETEEDDLPADTTTTGTVEVDGSAVRGDIYEPKFAEGDGPNEVDGWDFDTDWFEVELEADKTYRIDMWGHTTANGLTLRLPQINAIYDSKGSFIVNTWYSDESDSHYLFRVTFTASSNRSYYIAASGESFEWGTYKLWVKDITEDDHGDHGDEGDEGDGTNGGKGLKNLRAVEEKGGVRLTWQSPDGAAVTGYRIERRRAGGQGSGPQRSHGQPRDHHTLVEDTGNTETSYVDESAEQGVEYEYQVSAHNESGPGEESDWVRAGPEEEPVLGDALPGAPRNLTATPGNREVTLSWDPPADNGNAPATGYRIEWRVDGKDYDKTIWGTARSTTYTTNVNANLANGVKYFFRVSAGNGSGNSYGPYGPASGEVSATPTSGSAVDLGTPVLSNTENLHHGMVRLDWQDVEDAGWYVVQYYHLDGGSGEWVDLPAEGVDIAFHGSSAVVSNLHGLSWLRVGAMSCAGASEWSQIEELYGTNASDWEGVPVPEVEEGDEIEPCPVVLGTPVLSDTENLHHGMVQLDWQDIEDAGWYVVQYYHLEDEEWLDLPAEGVDIAFHGSSAVVSNLHGLSWLRVGAASCDGASEWSQIEQLFGTNASDWEGVPVPEVAEGDEIEPCDEDPDTPDNSPATGAPTISGTAQVGETLTANTSGIADADGLSNVQYEYQWLVDDTDISGATNATYTPVAADEGKAIKVEVSFTDDTGNGETLTSAATDAVAAAPTSNTPATGAPTISGTAQVGETLTADTSGIADADGLSSVQYEYQWLADDADISGATNATYTLTDSEESKAITVQVGFTDDEGNEESLTSAATDAVAAAPTPNSPATGVPTISGTVQVGETLTASTSGVIDADGLSNVQYEYQWLADDADISGATNATYTLAADDEGKTVKVQVSFTDDADNEETLTSAATTAVTGAQPTEPPTKPRGLDATATHDSVTLTWDDPGDDTITGYVILRRIPGDDPEGHFDVLVADTGTAATSYTDGTVEAETRYTYRIKAINGAGTSERSRWSHIDVPAAPVPDKPTGLEATASHDSVTLTWDDPGDDSITGYVILRRVRENNTGGDFDVLVADTGSAATTYTDDTVAAGTTYTYRIKAINEHGTSERSSWFHIDIPEAP